MKRSITFILFIIGLNSIAQSEDLLNKLLDKKWIITAYEVKGTNTPIPYTAGESYMVFNSDLTVKGKNMGVDNPGTWVFDPKENALILTKVKEKEKTIMKVNRLNEKEFIWESTTPAGMTMIVYMSN
jgi:hypothetical protein